MKYILIRRAYLFCGEHHFDLLVKLSKDMAQQHLDFIDGFTDCDANYDDEMHYFDHWNDNSGAETDTQYALEEFYGDDLLHGYTGGYGNSAVSKPAIEKYKKPGDIIISVDDNFYDNLEKLIHKMDNHQRIYIESGRERPTVW